MVVLGWLANNQWWYGVWSEGDAGADMETADGLQPDEAPPAAASNLTGIVADDGKSSMSASPPHCLVASTLPTFKCMILVHETDHEVASQSPSQLTLRFCCSRHQDTF